MKHADFVIGTEFFTSVGKWRCTDVGTRVIVAISLEPRRTVQYHNERNHPENVPTVIISTDPRDLIGPPYSVPEYVFDEFDIEEGTTEKEEEP